MKVREIKKDDVVILELSGRLTEGKDTDDLSENINLKIDSGLKKLIFDLKKVHWIDSSGLGLLIRAYTRMQKTGGELKLARVTRSVNNLLQMTKLTTVFAIHDTLDDASESF
ncbi:MAG TPA: anti-sigma factor antagonist [Candidatus Latescibacteria bacterium]|nr:anti-sigma factor antagonist [Candidatus Latescibacterota bacterium]